MSDVQDFTCRPSGDGGYRLSAVVRGRPVSLWTNVYQPTLTEPAALSLLELARRAEAHAS